MESSTKNKTKQNKKPGSNEFKRNMFKVLKKIKDRIISIKRTLNY